MSTPAVMSEAQRSELRSAALTRSSPFAAAFVATLRLGVLHQFLQKQKLV